MDTINNDESIMAPPARHGGGEPMSKKRAIYRKEPEYKVGSKFKAVLKKMCAETDQNIYDNLTFRVNERKRVLYINGTEYADIFMCVMIDYLEKIPYVHNLCQKHYIFGVGCVEFALDDNVCEQQKYDIPPSNVLNECLIECYRMYFRNASQYEKFAKDIRTNCKAICDSEGMSKSQLHKEWEKTNNEWIKLQ